jgi:hypothetical protein
MIEYDVQPDVGFLFVIEYDVESDVGLLFVV